MDDEADILSVGVLVLRHLGYDAIPVTSDQAAVTALAHAVDNHEPIDAVDPRFIQPHRHEWLGNFG